MQKTESAKPTLVSASRRLLQMEIDIQCVRDKLSEPGWAQTASETIKNQPDAAHEA